jgi:hypothetical protein
MKNKFKTIIVLLVVAITLTASAFAQKKGKSFKGTITYTMAYTGDAIEPAQLAQFPKESVVKVFENRTLTEQGPASVITNGDSKVVYTVIDLSSYGMKKYLISQKQEEIEKDNKGTKITYFEETKQILGYIVKKVEIIAAPKEDEEDEEGGTTKIIAYYTEELGGEEVNFGNQMFHGVKGVVLEYEVVTPKMKIVAVAKTVEKGKVKEADFLIPSDCVETTMEAFQEEMNALRGGGE